MKERNILLGFGGEMGVFVGDFAQGLQSKWKREGNKSQKYPEIRNKSLNRSVSHPTFIT